ncbi:MAG TPA: methyltransferase domain-containing protein, partial [Acidimicrobiales bacterium]|nr:methyltransferase domain-containing protein [Acidimicrobiales bacterium]
TMGTGTTAPKWDPQQYEQFSDERSRPFTDLLARVELPGAREIADLGCGTGSLTALLAQRWPAAHVVGVDNSPDMLGQAQARAMAGRLEFCLGDVRTWEPAAPLDVLVSNATLHWAPGHLGLIDRLAAFLQPGGMLALQVPGNFGEPTHRLLAELKSSDRWQAALGGEEIASPSSHDPGEYLEALLAAGLAAGAWETTYFQLLQGDDAVLEWMKGTALRPVLTALSEEEGDEFLREYGGLLRAAYPPRAHGTVLPYRRVFAVGRRAGAEKARGVIAGLDHVQLAMPPGEEDARPQLLLQGARPGRGGKATRAGSAGRLLVRGLRGRSAPRRGAGLPTRHQGSRRTVGPGTRRHGRQNPRRRPPSDLGR